LTGELEAIGRSTAPLSQDEITLALRALGVEDGGTVIAHVSLSALGWVAGGAQAVVAALLAAVGERALYGGKAAQLAAGEQAIFGVMLESFLVEGSQDHTKTSELQYGQSITDACMSWENTVPALGVLAEAVRKRRG